MKCNFFLKNMPVDYNNFSKTFAASRKNMKWEEVEYFFSTLNLQDDILDIWCGSWRLLELYQNHFWKLPDSYLGVDLSQWLLDEAKKSFPNYDFIQANMLDIADVTQGKKFNNIFLIASFHHLDSISDREKLLKSLKKLLTESWKIYMTNWALESSVHKEKYQDSYVIWSENSFWSKDFNIKFWKFDRYYHCFSLQELEYLAESAGLKIEENRLFDSEKNFVTILS